MGIISWIILGALAGWLASKIMGRDAQMGAVANIVVGIVGALLGGFIMKLIGGGTTGTLDWDIGSFLVALGGAVLLLAIFRGFRRGV